MVYSLEGELIHEFETKGSDPGKFHSLYGICIGDNGLVYVADIYGEQICAGLLNYFVSNLHKFDLGNNIVTILTIYSSNECICVLVCFVYACSIILYIVMIFVDKTGVLCWLIATYFPLT